MNKRDKMYIVTIAAWIVFALATYSIVLIFSWEHNLLLILDFSLTMVIFVEVWRHNYPSSKEIKH